MKTFKSSVFISKLSNVYFSLLFKIAIERYNNICYNLFSSVPPSDYDFNSSNYILFAVEVPTNWINMKTRIQGIFQGH